MGKKSCFQPYEAGGDYQGCPNYFHSETKRALPHHLVPTDLIFHTFESSFFGELLGCGLLCRPLAGVDPLKPLDPFIPVTPGEVIPAVPGEAKIPPPPVTSTTLPIGAPGPAIEGEGGATPTATCCTPGRGGHKTTPYCVFNLWGAIVVCAIVEGAATVEMGDALEEPPVVVAGCADCIRAGVGDTDTDGSTAVEDKKGTVGGVMKGVGCSSILGPDRGGRCCPRWYDLVKPLLRLCTPLGVAAFATPFR